MSEKMKFEAEDTMSDGDLRKAVECVEKEITDLPRPDGPLPRDEVTRRELLLFRQATLYNIQRARKQNEKNVEMFHIEVYTALRAFSQSY